MRYITIALSKGRLTELSIEVFERIGIKCPNVKDLSRKLILTDEENKIRFFLAKPSDVPTYVEYGAADMGIVGKDTIIEQGCHLYEVLNLGFGACRMVVAGPQEVLNNFDILNNKRVATKYPKIAREYFEHKRHETIEIIRLNGSVELAPLIGLSEVIVDLVETGKTLAENGLVEFDTIAQISARVIVNRVSMKMEQERISKIIEDIRVLVEKKG